MESSSSTTAKAAAYLTNFPDAVLKVGSFEIHVEHFRAGPFIAPT
jgi:hypothetical protein